MFSFKSYIRQCYIHSNLLQAHFIHFHMGVGYIREKYQMGSSPPPPLANNFVLHPTCNVLDGSLLAIHMENCIRQASYSYPLDLSCTSLRIRYAIFWFHYFPLDGHSCNEQDVRQEVDVSILSSNFLVLKSLSK